MFLWLVILWSKGLWSVQQLVALPLAYSLQMTTWHLYQRFLVLQIHGCELMSIIGHVAYLRYLTMSCQPSPLALCLPATSVFLLLLGVHAYITQLCLLITGRWLLVRSLLVVVRLAWCIQIIISDLSSLPTILTLQSLLLTSVL